jgi:DNA-binding NarL/FixJ family response regulator
VITVAITDQELTFADALAIRLDAEDDIKVVAVANASSGHVLGGCADVILLDADVAKDTAHLLRNANYSPKTRVVMLSHTSEPERIVAAIQAGAAAWIRKDESVGHLLEALRAVASGRTWLPAMETGHVLSPLLHQHESRSVDESAPVRLTRREQQVLDCLADGAGRNEVAARLLYPSILCGPTCRTSWPSSEYIRPLRPSPWSAADRSRIRACTSMSN